MSLVTVDGVPCSDATLTVPLVGCWTLEAKLSNDAPEGAPVRAEFGDLVLVGTLFRGGSFAGAGMLRAVGGKGGWRKDIDPKPYQSSFGIKVAPLVKDAARACGETVNVDAPGTVGPFWTRPARPAVWTLSVLCPRWWMGFDGVTVPTSRPEGSMQVRELNVVPEGTSLSAGRIVCSPASLAGVLPGLTFSAPSVPVPQVALTVVHRLADDRLRTEIWVR